MTGDLTAVDVELATARQEASADPGAYWRDATKVARHRALLEAKHEGESLPAKPSAAAGELAAIRAMMGDPSSPYHRDGGATAARYRQLLEGGETAPQPLAISLQDWLIETGDRETYPFAQAAVAAMNETLDGLDGDMRSTVAGGFDALPDGARQGVIGELMNADAVTPEEVTADDLGALRRHLPGLARAWGQDAARRLGTARARLWRGLRGMSDGDALRTIGWLDRLPVAAQAAVWGRLGG